MECHIHGKAGTPPGVSSGRLSAGLTNPGPQCLTCERTVRCLWTVALSGLA